jgi:hypothetical protein
MSVRIRRLRLERSHAHELETVLKLVLKLTVVPALEGDPNGRLLSDRTSRQNWYRLAKTWLEGHGIILDHPRAVAGLAVLSSTLAPTASQNRSLAGFSATSVRQTRSISSTP